MVRLRTDSVNGIVFHAEAGDSALREPADVGFAQLSFEGIAARAGTGKAALYRT